MRSRIGPKSMREPHHGCASRWASTAAAALCAPSFLYAFAARLATVLIEIPNSAAMSLCVLSRPMRSSVVHSRAVSGRTRVGGERLVTWDLHRPRRAAEPLLLRPYRSPPIPVVPHASTRWPTGAAARRGGFGAHPGQEPPHGATHAARPPACWLPAPSSGARLRSRHTVCRYRSGLRGPR